MAEFFDWEQQRRNSEGSSESKKMDSSSGSHSNLSSASMHSSKSQLKRDSKVKTSFNNGVLELTIPKQKKAHRKRIEVK